MTENNLESCNHAYEKNRCEIWSETAQMAQWIMVLSRKHKDQSLDPWNSQKLAWDRSPSLILVLRR